MDSIELSSILDCFGDQITIENTKTYTIWLEMIANVLNMLIELKGNNYYSKVFKRVNYKLQNNTFWVVIRQLDNKFNLCFVHFNVLLWDNMPKDNPLVYHEMTFFLVKHQIFLNASVQNNFQVD